MIIPPPPSAASETRSCNPTPLRSPLRSLLGSPRRTASSPPASPCSLPAVGWPRLLHPVRAESLTACPVGKMPAGCADGHHFALPVGWLWSCRWSVMVSGSAGLLGGRSDWCRWSDPVPVLGLRVKFLPCIFCPLSSFPPSVTLPLFPL